MKKIVAAIISMLFILSLFALSVSAITDSYEVINKVLLTDIEVPIPDKTPDFEAVCETKGVEIVNIYWSDSATGETFIKGDGKKFTTGKEYILYVDVSLQDSYKFKDNGKLLVVDAFMKVFNGGYFVSEYNAVSDSTAVGSSTIRFSHQFQHICDPVRLKPVKSTCTKAGLTEGWYCSVCDDILSEQLSVEMLDHTEVTVKGKAATYKSTGLTDGKKCSVCGTVTVKQKKTDRKNLSKVKVKGLKTKSVKLASGSGSSLTLTWTKLSGVDKYEIQQYNGKKWKSIKTTSKTSYTVGKLKANTSYKFRIRAIAGSYKSAWSSTYTGKTVPLKPSLTLKAGKNLFTASWKKVAETTGYELQYSTSEKFTAKTTKTVKISKAATVKKTVKKLKKGKKYFVRIRAYKTVSGKKIYSSWSAVKNVKVK